MNKRMTDMTQGSPIRHLLIFAGPLILGNLFQQFYNMVDSIVVGQFVGKNALAAVGACGSMNFLFFSLSFGLSNGIGVMTSHAFGAGDENAVRRTIANSYYVLASVSVLISAIAYAISPALLRALDTPEAIIADSTAYMRITVLGILGITLYNGVAAILRALGDSRTPLYFLIFSSLLNVGLDLLFVLYFSMGVRGVGLATIVSQYSSAFISFLYAFRKVDYFRCTRQERRPDHGIIRGAFRLGVPLSLQSSMIAVSCLALQGVVNGFGENVVAAFTITNRVEQIIQQPFNSLGAALMTFSGQNMGAGKPDRVRQGFRQATGVAFVFSMAMLPVMYLFGDTIAGFFVKEAEVISIGSRALRITSLFYFPLGMIYLPRALSNGCGDAGFSMINGITEVIGRVAFSQLFLFLGWFGFWAVWATTAATWTTTGIVCMLRYFSGKWKKGFDEQRKAMSSIPLIPRHSHTFLRRSRA